MKRLVPASAAAVGVFAYLQWQGAHDHGDTAVLTGLGVTSTISAVSMLFLTRVWSLRAVGLLMMMAGIAIYADTYALILTGIIPRSSMATALNMVRSVWSIGVPLFAYGLIMMFVSLWRGSREGEPSDM